MRFIATFLTISLFVVFLAGVGFYFTREYILYRGVENFKKSVLVLQRNNPTSICAEKSTDLLGVGPESASHVVQVRFTSDTEYVSEVLCSGFSFDPYVIETRALDSFVTKDSGSAGILLSAERSGVTLTAFKDLEDEINQVFKTNWTFIGKSRTVVLENNDFVLAQPNEDLGVTPVSSCEGFGFQCCDVDAEQGVGDPLKGVTSCEQSCYSSCVRRPLVLSLNSNPFFDVTTRVVSVRAGESVDFGYVIDPGVSKNLQVIVDFGDGSTEESTEATATVSHVYSCPSGSCEYIVSVRASDAMGIQSTMTAVSQLKVEVSASAIE